jgi:hypothetical protein
VQLRLEAGERLADQVVAPGGRGRRGGGFGGFGGGHEILSKGRFGYRAGAGAAADGRGTAVFRRVPRPFHRISEDRIT